jgi:hypothetical protein
MSYPVKVNGLESEKDAIEKGDGSLTFNYYNSLIENTNSLRGALLSHSIYNQVTDLASLRIFMELHIFAVWDFMTLIKTLQRRLTCVEVPWMPPQDATSARFVNDIVLGEETDEIQPGRYLSHFELYLLAMEEIGANTQSIHAFLQGLRRGYAPAQALAPLSIPATTKHFVLNTLHSAQRPTHEVAATFLLGREDIIPKMFHRLLGQLEQTSGIQCDAFRVYLERHMHLDEECHAPMGQKLLMNLCGEDAQKWQDAQRITEQALQCRYFLWNGIAEAIGTVQPDLCLSISRS